MAISADSDEVPYNDFMKFADINFVAWFIDTLSIKFNVSYHSYSGDDFLNLCPSVQASKQVQ